MDFSPTEIRDVVVITPRVFEDHRGFFLETWNARTFSEAGHDWTFVQDNHSRSFRYTLRGLHYQVVRPQGKLVRAIAGSVFDVAVDLRRSSSTFGKWVGVELSVECKRMLWIPPGFAHGFCVTSDVAEIEYKCTDNYAPAFERCIRWDDPELAIDWPIPQDIDPVVSNKDARGVAFADADVYV